MGKKNKIKIYSSSKRKMTNEELIEFEQKMQKQRDKFERDSGCGGVGDFGYIRLHDRWEKK